MTEIIRIDLGGVNSYLLKGEEGFVLVDTGGPMAMDKGLMDRRDLLLSAVSEAGCRKGDLRLLVLTHGDCDHVFNAAFIRKEYGAEVAMHRGDYKLVQNLEVSDYMKSFSYRSPVMKLVFCILRKKIELIAERTIENFDSFQPDLELTEGFSLKSYGVDARVLSLPGHTEGSVAVLTKEGDLIAGDLFANLKKPAAAANAIDFAKLDKSIERVREYGIKKVYPGHGVPFLFSQLK